MTAATILWDADRDAKLKGWVAEGKSRGWIANCITQETKIRCTRNMVAGRIYRLKLTTPVRRQQLQRNRTKPPQVQPNRGGDKTLAARLSNGRAPHQPPQLQVDPNAPVPLFVATMDLRYNHCRDVVDDTTPGAWFHCGHHSDDGRWCQYHHEKYLKKAVR